MKPMLMKRALMILSLLLVVAAGTVACDPSDGGKGGGATADKADDKGGDKAAEKPADKGGEKAAEKPAEKGGDEGAAKGGDEGAEKGDGEAPAEEKDGGLEVKSELYKIKFVVPEGWKVNKGPTGISVVAPDNGLAMLVAGSKSQDVLEAALRDLKSNVSFKDVKIEKQGATVINGLAGIRGEGDVTLIQKEGEGEEAKEKESPVHFLAFLAKVDDNSLTTVIYAEKSAYDSNVAVVEAILETFDKM